MYLTSDLESNGPKSTHHYLVLHNNGRRNLVKLPKSYSDLEEKVNKLFYIERGSFCLETTELNICKGERVRVEAGDWDDISQLLGNVHVVPIEQPPPEAQPEPFSEKQANALVLPSAKQGVIDLTSPFEKDDEYLVIDVGKIDFDVDSTSTTKFNIQVLDKNGLPVINVSIFPKTGWVSLTSSEKDTFVTLPLRDVFLLDSDHHIVLFRRNNCFMLSCDTGLVASVQAPTHSPLTSLQYSLGVQTPFKGPIFAKVYSSFAGLCRGYRIYGTIFGEPIDKETLYLQMLACQTGDSAPILKALATIRRENSSFKHSSSGINWKRYSPKLNTWDSLDWDMQPHSVLVVRLEILAYEKPQTIIVRFGPKTRPALVITITPDNEVQFEESDGKSLWIKASIKLPFSMLSPGEHSLTFINREKDLHIIFDFLHSHPYDNSTILTRVPKTAYFQWPSTYSTNVDKYEFR